MIARIKVYRWYLWLYVVYTGLFIILTFLPGLLFVLAEGAPILLVFLPWSWFVFNCVMFVLFLIKHAERKAILLSLLATTGWLIMIIANKVIETAQKAIPLERLLEGTETPIWPELVFALMSIIGFVIAIKLLTRK